MQIRHAIGGHGTADANTRSENSVRVFAEAGRVGDRTTISVRG